MRIALIGVLPLKTFLLGCDIQRTALGMHECCTHGDDTIEPSFGIELTESHGGKRQAVLKFQDPASVSSDRSACREAENDPSPRS
ncbi:hypothetical protein D3C78_1416750 [compost metagenome]